MKRGSIDATYDANILGALLVSTIGGAMAASSHGAANDEVIAKQKATLDRLDELQKAADQLKVFTKRTGG